MVALVAPLLLGYVVPPLKVLERWERSRPSGGVALPLELPVEVAGSPARLRVTRTGAKLAGPAAPPVPRSVAVAAALFAADGPEGWAALLSASGVDTSRAGYARDACSLDGVVLTLGARGEGEPEMPQVWFARSPLRPCRVILSPDDRVEIGPPGAGGWPAWFQTGDGLLLVVTGSPEPVPLGDLLPLPGMPAPLPENWRRAF